VRQWDSKEARELEKQAWTVPFSEQFFSGVEEKEIGNAFARTKFIVFNYDRCLEQFLLIALCCLYQMPDLDARTILKSKLEVIHPFGSLGDMLGIADSPIVKFGERPSRELAATSLKLFTEDGERSTVRTDIAKYITWAEQVVFLGNAYHAQNMKLLSYPAKKFAKVLGTGVGLSDTARQEAVKRISDAFGPHDGGLREHIEIKPMHCAELLAAEAVALAT
jgi:hypothetical protein